MRLYLVRHAEAAVGTRDELRPLTPDGREQARALGADLREAGVLPDAIVTSPLLRARETARLVGQELGVEMTVDDRLSPGATADALSDAVAGRGQTVIAVGHQPDCSRIAAALTGESAPDFPPASALAISLER
jgi:phosphohistidine phosphatase